MPRSSNEISDFGMSKQRYPKSLWHGHRNHPPPPSVLPEGDCAVTGKLGVTGSIRQKTAPSFQSRAVGTFSCSRCSVGWMLVLCHS